MWYRSYESSSPKRILTYFFWVICGFWVIITSILCYQFLSDNWEVVSKKWWTFVEAIFDQISYLPYLKNDWQSVFYQSFLFDSCIDYSTLSTEWLEGTNCKIITQDYQTYYVSVEWTWKQWSDGTPWSIDDVFFTYDKIIRQNAWEIKSLTSYQSLKVEKEEWRIKITFPTSTTDNNYFFTNYILPNHILWTALYWDYIWAFAAAPITSSCGKLQPKSSDDQSLVFNLMWCENTKLWYYQIKNYDNFEVFSKSVIEEWNRIVDMYAHQLQLGDYARRNIIKSDMLSFFFNTKSPKMKVRLRRALWGLINAKFYVWDEYWKFLKMYREPLLTSFYSDWSNIKEFINRVSLTEKDDWVGKQELEDSWVQVLKTPISINWVERKFIFYTPIRTETFNFEIRFSNQFENIKVTDSKWNQFSPKNYKKTDKKIVYPLEVWKNLNQWLNQYTIVWTIKWKTYTIANIDLYMINIEWTQQVDDQNDWKIKVVYYNNLESNFSIKQFKKILEDAWIIENFVFEQVSSPEALEAKLIMEDYDILLNTINLWMKKDVLRILTTSDAAVNPSLYTNPNLTSLFKQYTKASQKDEIIGQINAIYAQDMPFVIVWYPYSFVNLKNELLESSLWTSGFLYEFTWRDYLLEHITLIKSKNLDFSKLLDFWGFVSYFKNKIKNSFDGLNIKFFIKESSEDVVTGEENGSWDVITSWEVVEEVNTWEVAEEINTWEYEIIDNYEWNSDPFAWLIQPLN